MKTAASWILFLAVVPALLLAMYMIERSGSTDYQRPSGMPASEIGFVDGAGDSAGNETVSTPGVLYVWGWAADGAKGAPVDRVVVYVDGISAGAAMLGGVRQDVEEHYGRSDYSKSGWDFSMLASRLRSGTHTVTATAFGFSGTAQLAANRMVTITNGKQR